MQSALQKITPTPARVDTLTNSGGSHLSRFAGCSPCFVQGPEDLLLYHPEWGKGEFRLYTENQDGLYSLEEWQRTSGEIDQLVGFLEQIRAYPGGVKMIQDRFHHIISAEAFRTALIAEAKKPDAMKYIMRNQRGEIIGWSDLQMRGTSLVLNRQSAVDNYNKTVASDPKNPELRALAQQHRRDQQKILMVSDRTGEVSYFIHPDYSGNGFGKLATMMAIYGARHRSALFDRVFIEVDQSNGPSKKIALHIQKLFHEMGVVTYSRSEDLEDDARNYYIEFGSARDVAENTRQLIMGMQALVSQHVNLALGLVQNQLHLWIQACTPPQISRGSAA